MRPVNNQMHSNIIDNHQIIGTILLRYHPGLCNCTSICSNEIHGKSQINNAHFTVRSTFISLNRKTMDYLSTALTRWERNFLEDLSLKQITVNVCPLCFYAMVIHKIGFNIEVISLSHLNNYND